MVRNVLLLLGLFLSLNLFSQYSISGSVMSETGDALIGATVVIHETNSGVVTDQSGSFELSNVPEGTYELRFSYLGYSELIETVELSSNIELEIVLIESSILAEEVVVSSTRAGQGSPVAYTDVSKEELNDRNLGQDLPYLLSITPSMVVSSDAGAGVGYTSFRIRGTDANRINVTVNGIPMNDAESHGVWWVNMPDFTSSLENVQVQRGVGTSTNGAGAFGASINMQTKTTKEEPYGEINSSFGSFNTFKNTVKLGTGLLGKHFAFDARLSRLSSDGYVDRATSDLKSYFISGGYFSERTMVKVNVFSGKENTYQSWNGVPKVRLEDDLEGMQRYQDHYLYTEEETQHMINSDSRTYNFYTYDNETDNYQQDHYQMFFSQKIGAFMNFNAALHYTYGRGYYEQYRVDDDFEDYGLSNVVTPNDTIESTDLVRQKWLDNDFYGTTFSLNYKNGALDAVVGGAWNQYDGRHFGKVIWAQYLGDTPKDYEWYRNTGLKTDMNVYGKLKYSPVDVIGFFVDLQYRLIEHEIEGMDDDLRDISQKHNFNFFNPKFGIVVKPGSNQEAYASFAIANREPNRSNYTDVAPDGKEPTYETLYDLELGYTYKQSNFSVGANIYNMSYNNQLILTGEINDVGSAIMVNADKSYRRGVEIFGGVKIASDLKWEANATFSQNKIKDFTEYVDNWDTWGQETNLIGETDIAFSPNLLATSVLTYSPLNKLNVGLISQYVSEQFIDNTSNKDRMLDAYFLNNIKLDYTIKLKEIKAIEFSILLNNVLGEVYESNAWVYSYVYGGERYAMDGYFPQAGFNFLAGISFSF